MFRPWETRVRPAAEDGLYQPSSISRLNHRRVRGSSLMSSARVSLSLTGSVNTASIQLSSNWPRDLQQRGINSLIKESFENLFSKVPLRLLRPGNKRNQGRETAERHGRASAQSCLALSKGHLFPSLVLKSAAQLLVWIFREILYLPKDKP